MVRNHNGTPFLPDQLLERYLTGLPLKGFPYEDAVSLCDAMRRLVGWQEIRYKLEKYIEKQVQERFFLVGERDDGFIVGTSIARLTRRYDDFPRYEVSTLLERERSIQEISGQIQDYALPFFARFSDLPKLLDDVEREGFFPHRKGFDVPKRNREFIECFREYLQKQQANGLSY